MKDGKEEIEAAAERERVRAEAMRHALERILDIEGYGAPLIEVKCIAQKALEGQQCTPPIAQERPKIEQPGNAASMRAALEAMLEECCNLCDVPNQMSESGHTCSWRNRWSGCQSKAIDKARAALDAPARNCDRYRTEADAEDAFDRFCAKMRTGECKPWKCPLRSTGGKYCFVTWLLGPVAERKGDQL